MLNNLNNSEPKKNMSIPSRRSQSQRQYNFTKEYRTISNLTNKHNFPHNDSQKDKHSSVYTYRLMKNKFSIVQKPQITQNGQGQVQLNINQKKQRMFAKQYHSNLLKTIYRQTAQQKRSPKKASNELNGLYDISHRKKTSPYLKQLRGRNHHTATQISFLKNNSPNNHGVNGPSATQLPILSNRPYKKFMNTSKLSPDKHNKSGSQLISKKISSNIAKKQKNSIQADFLENKSLNPWETYHDQFIQ